MSETLMYTDGRYPFVSRKGTEEYKLLQLPQTRSYPVKMSPSLR
jgi:hypothetical protein